MQELNFEEIEVVSGGNMPETSVGGSSDWNWYYPACARLSIRIFPYEKQLHQQGKSMQELNTHEIEEVSGGNMPESSVGGDTSW